MSDNELIAILLIVAVTGIIMMVTALAKSRAIKEAENNWTSNDHTQQSKPDNTAQKAEVTGTQTQDKKCIFCGAGISKDPQFCGSCGRRVD